MNFIHGTYLKPGGLVKIFGPLRNDQNKISVNNNIVFYNKLKIKHIKKVYNEQYI